MTEITMTLECAGGHSVSVDPKQAEELNGTACQECFRPLLVTSVRAGGEQRDPSCATVTLETDRAHALRYAAAASTFDEWWEAICDDFPIPVGLEITNGQVEAIARACWSMMPLHDPTSS